MERVLIESLMGNNKRIKTLLYLLKVNTTPLCSDDVKNLARIIEDQVNNSEVILNHLNKGEGSTTASYE